MNRPRPFQQRLEAWLDEGPTAAPPDLLGGVLASVPRDNPRRRRLGAGRSLFVLSTSARLAATIAAVLVIGLVGFTLLNSKGPGIGGTGTTPSMTPTPTTVPTPTPIGTAPTASSVKGPPPTPGPALCAPASLVAHITSWDGAAGHRIATVELKNVGSSACETRTLDRPQLVGGDGTILITGAPIADAPTLTLDSGQTATTLVQDGNYCGATPVAPVTVAFILSTGAGRVVAAPMTPTDTEGIPPCNSTPGSAGDIEMQPWTVSP